MAEEEEKASNLEALHEFMEIYLPKNEPEDAAQWYIPLAPSEDNNEREEDSQLDCLGVANYCAYFSPFVNLINADSVYGQLPRPAKLPPTECPITTIASCPPESQELVTRLWNGCFVFKVMDPMPRGREDGPLKLVIWAGTEKSKNIDSTVEIEFKFMGGNHRLAYIFSDHINKDWDICQERRMCARVLHHILRQFGWMFPWVFLNAMFHTLQSIWTQSKKYKRLVLDSRLIQSDLLHNISFTEIENTCTPANAIFAVGSALEALGRFQESEAICMEVAQNYSPANPDEEARAYLRAGVSCLRDVRYDLSLTHLLKSLQILARVPGRFDWSKGDSNAAICSLLMLHWEMSQVKRLESHDGSGKHKLGLDEKVFASFVCLLVEAKFVPVDSSTKGFLDESVHYMGFLKSTYHKPKLAKRLLISSFRTEGVEGYKESLLGAVQRGDWILEYIPELEPTGPFDERTLRREARRQAQMLIKESAQRKTLQSCSNCAMLKPVSKTLICLCGITYYCSKECQVEHWKSHKNACTWHLEQKQKKPKDG